MGRSMFMKMIIDEQTLGRSFSYVVRIGLASNGLGLRAADPCGGDVGRLWLILPGRSVKSW